MLRSLVQRTVRASTTRRPPARFTTTGASLAFSSLNEFAMDFAAPLGSGVCGSVYSGVHRCTGQDVAVKLISPVVLPGITPGGDAASEGAEREKNAFEHVLQGGASHPNVMQLFGCFEGELIDAARQGLHVPKDAEVSEDSVHYSVMELLEGPSLGDKLHENGSFEEDEAKDVTRAICAGLDFLHQQGIAHRDVKPSNVLCTLGGEPKLIDFSHAGVVPEIVSPDAAWFEKRLGTPGFVAPEVMAQREPYSLKCDVYSLGCTVHAMLANGKAPRFYSRCGTITMLPDTVSPAGAAFIRALLHSNPQERPTIAEALQDPWLQAC